MHLIQGQEAHQTAQFPSTEVQSVTAVRFYTKYSSSFAWLYWQYLLK